MKGSDFIMEETKLKIRAFLSRYFNSQEVSDNQDIFGLGFVNSLFAMQLVMFIEKDFKIRVDNKDLDLNNFRTINSIVEFVTSKALIA